MNIISNNGFYYLSNTFRKGGKVIHRKKYLGKTIPLNIEDIKELFLRECMQEELIAKLKKIKKNFNSEWKKFPDSVKREYLIDLSVKFTYNTNAIEGSKITYDETENVLKRKISPSKPLSDVQETVNHAKVFLKVMNEKEKLSKNLMLKWHKDIFSDSKPDIAGFLREYSVCVGSYRAPDWQDINKLMQDFLKWYISAEKIMNPVEIAARAHYKFEKIHPFGDGNGRIGRLIIAYILRKYSYPVLIIQYMKRKSYYHALEKTENGFVNYFVQRYVKGNKEYLK